MKTFISNLQCGVYKVQLRLSMLLASFMCSPVALVLAEGKDKGEETKTGDGEQAVNDILSAEGNGAFDNATEVTQGIGASGYALIRTVSAAALVVSIIVLGLTLAFHAGNQQKQAEGKSTAVNIIIGACIAFGAFSLLGVVIGIAGSFAK